MVVLPTGATLAIMTLAPVAVFAYNRPGHLAKTLEALSTNSDIANSLVYIFCDGPKSNASIDELEQIERTRRIAREYSAAASVFCYANDFNKGLAQSIVEGIDTVLSEHDRIIVLEDDVVTSPGFLGYMNAGLGMYCHNDLVMQISAFMYPIELSGRPNDTLFYNVNSCWGWGTWKRAWRYYCDDAGLLLARLRRLGLTSEGLFRYNGGQGNAYWDQLERNADGRLRTWAVKWHTAMFLRGGFCLHPKKSLTRNIGFDGSGTNCGNTAIEIELCPNIDVYPIPLSENAEVRKRMARFWRSRRPSLLKRLARLILNSVASGR